jgi:hypothetical protein
MNESLDSLRRSITAEVRAQGLHAAICEAMGSLSLIIDGLERLPEAAPELMLARKARKRLAAAERLGGGDG